MAKLFIVAGSLNAALCIMLGAFAAHGLKQRLSEYALGVFQTGVQYHFYHSFALLFLGLLLLHVNDPMLRFAGLAFIIGIVLFSGSLYGLSFELASWLGPITPIGGLSFILGWLLIALAVFRTL